MKRWQKILLSIVVILGVSLAGIFAARAINQQRYYALPEGAPNPFNYNPTDPSTYPINEVEGVTVIAIKGEHMAGFHLKPEKRTRPGVMVAYGGSEGGAGWLPAVSAAKLGQESLALFFWGQPNQTPMLDEVPLDHFQEVIDWVNEHAESPKPFIALGASKGAEYVANLLPRYPEIDHAFLQAPSSHSFPALSQNQTHGSWTYQGKPVPFITWEQGGEKASQAIFSQMWKFVVNVPVEYGPSYGYLLDHAPEETRIRIEDSKASIHIVAGEDDRVWPSARMAAMMKEASPDTVETTIYPGVGHAPGAPQYIGGLVLGGTNEANFAVADDYAETFKAKLDEWAPEE